MSPRVPLEGQGISIRLTGWGYNSSSRRRDGNRRRCGSRDEPTSLCWCPGSACSKLPACRVHIQVPIVVSVLCLMLMCFVAYDLDEIARFMTRFQAYARSDTDELARMRTNDRGSVSDGDYTRRYDGMSAGELVRRYEMSKRQEVMAIALLIALVLLMASAVTVYPAYKRRSPLLFMPFLILTFPVLTFCMIYAILFRQETGSAVIYIKIVAVVIVYTVIAHVYRIVYRVYRYLRARGTEDQTGTGVHGVDDVFSITQAGQIPTEPIVLRMKPPPYEKEPPPYSLTVPDISVPPYTEEAPTHIVNGCDSDTSYGAPVYNSEISQSPETTKLTQDDGQPTNRPAISQRTSSIAIETVHDQTSDQTTPEGHQNPPATSQLAVSALERQTDHAPVHNKRAFTLRQLTRRPGHSAHSASVSFPTTSSTTSQGHGSSALSDNTRSNSCNITSIETELDSVTKRSKSSKTKASVGKTTRESQKQSRSRSQNPVDSSSTDQTNGQRGPRVNSRPAMDQECDEAQCQGVTQHNRVSSV